MNKIIKKEKVNGTVEKTFESNQKETYIFLSEEQFNITLTVLDNTVIEIFHYGKNVSGTIKIHLKNEKATIHYHYNTFNLNENKVDIKIFHDAPNTESNLYMHGYNTKEEALRFLVDVFIPKGMKKVVATQENRIYNEQKAFSLICPNLYVEEYDVTSTHSSFIGPFDKNIIFYMETRGLSKKIAKQLLLEGFLIGEGLTEDEKIFFFQTRKEGEYESI